MTSICIDIGWIFVFGMLAFVAVGIFIIILGFQGLSNGQIPKMPPPPRDPKEKQ